MAVLVIFYKYNLKSIPEPLLACLVRIVMNSLESQYHTCRRIPTTIYQQDLPKKLDIGQSDDEQLLSQTKLQTQLKKLSDVSIECDETESELVAIPESDLSDSTLHGSIDGGMSDDVNLLKIDFKRKPDQAEVKKSRPPPLDTSSKTLSEGVRMMFSSAILSPPVNVQKAVVVTQSQYARPSHSVKDSCSTAVASAANNQLKTVSAVACSDKPSASVSPIVSSGQRSPSPTPRVLGRQQRIIDTNGEDMRKNHMRAMDSHYYGSPESPLSRMDVLSPPDDTDISTDGNETMMTTEEVKRLELPAPERLLPIGGPSKENISSLVDRVREGLSIPDISHLRSQENLDEKSDLSPPNSSRAASPRRLIKQIALVESPPGCGGSKDFVQKIEAKRQVSHKVPAKTIDERLRYAGSWPPPSSQDHDDDDETTSNKAMSYVSIDTKPVSFIIRIFKFISSLKFALFK